MAFPQNGIAIVPKDGPSEIITEDNGLASNNIKALDAVSGKLYAVIGGFRKIAD